MNTISKNTEESQSGFYKLPDGWVWIILKDVSNISDRDHTTPKYEDSGYPLISPKIFTDYGIDISKAKYVGDKEYSAFEKKCNPEKGDLLYSRIGTIGEVRLLDFDYKFVALHSIALIKPNYGFTCSKYLLYLMQSLNIKHQAIGNVQSVGVPDLGLKRMKNFSIPLPPLAEQHRIVEKIEEEFTRLDAGVKALKHAKALIPKYRQSVLKSAMCGDITKEWRALHPDVESAEVLIEKIIKYKKDLIKKSIIKPQKNVKNIDLEKKPFALPNSWIWQRWDTISLKIGDVDHKMPEESNNGIPYVSPKNFHGINEINFEKAKKISVEDFERLKVKIQPECGDLIFPRYGTIGENRLVITDDNFLASYSCAVIKCLNRYLNQKYVYYYSISPLVKLEIQKYVNETTQANVGLKSIQIFIFPLPPLEEQHEIVCEIERRFSIIDEMERVVNESLLKAERLRQSVLKKAFEGRLVSQNPDDEPAGVLLERIQAEKELRAAEGKANGKKKSAGKKKVKKADAE